MWNPGEGRCPGYTWLLLSLGLAGPRGSIGKGGECSPHLHITTIKSVREPKPLREEDFWGGGNEASERSRGEGTGGS